MNSRTDVGDKNNKIFAAPHRLVGEGPEELKELVKKYQVCWEVWPEYLMVDGNKQQVGFELVLAGAHQEGAHPTPGCPKCLDLFQHLKRIANWLLPDEERQSMYE